MSPAFSKEVLANLWCNGLLTSEHVSSILYYYAKYVKNVEISDELMAKTIAVLPQLAFNVDLAMHDIINKCELDVTTVWSKPDIYGRRQILYRFCNS